MNILTLYAKRKIPAVIDCYYAHIGGHVTTPEETAKYLEMAKKFFKVKSSN